MSTTTISATITKSTAPGRPKRDGSRFECPAPEGMVLSTETEMCLSRGSFNRVLDSFVFLVKGKPSSISGELFSSQTWQDVQAIGAVASLVGKDSPLVQCGLFNLITWRWMHIPVITGIHVTHVDSYRGGATCMLLTTPMGRYIVLSPHKRFAPLWNQSVTHFGSEAPAFRFDRYVPDGPTPDWWDERALGQWPPSATGHGTKRPPPTGVQHLEASTIRDKEDEQGQDESNARRVRRRESPPVGFSGQKGLVSTKIMMKGWDLVGNSYPKNTSGLEEGVPSISRPRSA